jgi:hypothetical protein
MSFIDKIKENLASIKLWTLGIATALLLLDKIGEATWAGLAAGLMGVARVFEYYAARKNGNAK